MSFYMHKPNKLPWESGWREWEGGGGGENRFEMDSEIEQTITKSRQVSVPTLQPIGLTEFASR